MGDRLGTAGVVGLPFSYLLLPNALPSDSRQRGRDPRTFSCHPGWVASRRERVSKCTFIPNSFASDVKHPKLIIHTRKFNSSPAMSASGMSWVLYTLFRAYVAGENRHWIHS